MNLFRVGALRTISDPMEKLRFLLLLLLVFSLPYDLFYSSAVFFTLCIITLIDIDGAKLKRIPSQFWIFQVVYFLGVLGYLNSHHRSAAGFLLERQLTILLFPLLLPLAIEINKEKVELILKMLVVSSTVAVLYLFCSMLITITFDFKLPLMESVFSGSFFNHQFSKPIGIHAGYLSLYVATAALYVCQMIVANRSAVGRSLLILIGTILFLGLLFLASRNTLIVCFFILLLIFPLFNVKRKIQYIVLLAACSLIAFLTVRNVPYLKERFSIDLISEIKPLKSGEFLNYQATEPRIERWKAAAHIIQRSPVIGYGTGDEVEMLKTQYAERGLFISYVENFNAHNQYLSYLIKNGIVGLIIFLAALFFYFRLALKTKNFMYLSILLLLFMGFYTENILDANKGIVFFSLFNTLFGYLALDELQIKR